MHKHTYGGQCLASNVAGYKKGDDGTTLLICKIVRLEGWFCSQIVQVDVSALVLMFIDWTGSGT